MYAGDQEEEVKTIQTANGGKGEGMKGASQLPIPTEPKLLADPQHPLFIWVCPRYLYRVSGGGEKSYISAALPPGSRHARTPRTHDGVQSLSWLWRFGMEPPREEYQGPPHANGPMLLFLSLRTEKLLLRRRTFFSELGDRNVCLPGKGPSAGLYGIQSPWASRPCRG